MGLILFFRGEQQVNNFRTTLLSLIEDTELDKVVLTYPYYSENKRNDGGVISNYAILDRGIRKSILSRDNYTVATVSPLKLIDEVEDSWTVSYRNFVNNLRRSISGTNIEYLAFFLSSSINFSHAKFCIGYKLINEEYVPVVLMLGSSNLTNKTIEYYPDFNYEADVLIWDDNSYQFNSNTICDGNLRPIYSVPKNDEDVKRYLEYFNNELFIKLGEKLLVVEPSEVELS